MATRGNKIALEHVRALNSIELIFAGSRKERAIVERWNEYLDHLLQTINKKDKDFMGD